VYLSSDPHNIVGAEDKAEVKIKISALPPPEWQQIAPMYCTYGFDVITTIGWQRQTSRLSPDEHLIRLQHGLSEALKCFTNDYDQLSEVAGWLIHISTLLDPEENPCPGSLEETISALSCVDMDEFREERQRLRNHRSRFGYRFKPGHPLKQGFSGTSGS